MFKVTYRVGLLVSERKVGPVLRHLLELAKFVQVVAPPNDLATEAGKLRLLTVFEHAPTQSEIAKLERAGAVLPERTRAGLEAVWRGAVHQELKRPGGTLMGRG
ncbi:MAG: hypothetical protein ACK5O3_11135, partial [Burkholderiales bacterium]